MENRTEDGEIFLGSVTMFAVFVGTLCLIAGACRLVDWWGNRKKVR